MSITAGTALHTTTKASRRGVRQLLVAVCTASMVAAGVSTVAAAPALAAGDVTALPTGPRPNATRVEFPVSDRVQASVDVGTGNLLVTTTDLVLPGVANDVQFGVDFNSLALRYGSPLPSGAAGPGWADRLGQDTKLIENSDGSVVYLAPGGLEGDYAPSGPGAYTTPVGFKNTLVQVSGGGWQLTDHATGAVSKFDTSGRLTSITDRNGNATALQYSSGRMSSITSTRGGSNARTMTVTVDAAGRVSTVTQASDTGGSRSVSYGYGDGDQLASITDATGATTQFGYSDGGDLTSITNPNGSVTTIGYGGVHRVTSVRQEGTGAVAAVTRFAYTSDTKTLVAGPNTDPAQAVAAVPHTSYTLDDTDRVTEAVDPLGRSRTTSYTPLADIASTTSGGGGTTSTEHGTNEGESLTKVTSPTGASVSLDYTGTGSSKYLPTAINDAQGNQALLTYDGAGNRLSGANTPTGASASVTYHADGTLESSTDPKGKVTSYGEDVATKQTTSIHPPAGSGLGDSTIGYDGYGRVSSVTNGAGKATYYVYDLNDRVTKVRYGDYTPAVTYSYDDAGNRTGRTDVTGTTTWGYDGLNRLTSRTSTSGGGTLTWTRDAAGNVTADTDGAGTSTYTYDDADQLLTTRNPNGLLTKFGYNDDGQRIDTWWRVKPDQSWSAHTHTTFDASGRVARTWTAKTNDDTDKVFDTSYCHSPYVAGQACPTTSATSDTALIQWSADNLSGARSLYTYDGANRLTNVTNYHGHTYAYGYDANGNRTTAKVDGTVVQSRSFNAGNQITNTGYTYDQAGNRTHDPDAGDVTYNGAGQMVTAGTSTYAYADTGQAERVTRTGPGSSTFTSVYGATTPQGVPVLESLTKNTNTYYFDNDPATGQPIDFHQPNTQSDYLVTDGIGSVVGIVSGDNGGTLIGTYTYDPYGVQTDQTGSAFGMEINPYRHAGGLLDPATGWIRHGTRYNDTTTGAWTTTDPITRLADPTNANPYHYAGSNPCNYTDPTGLDISPGEACVVGAVSVGIAGAASGAYSGALVGGVGALPGAIGGFIAGAVGGCVGGALGQVLYNYFDQD